MQNILIITVIAISAFFIGRRLYRNLKNSGGGGSCGCSCTQCGPDFSSSCQTKPPEAE